MASLLNMSGGSLLNKGSLLPSGYTQVEYIENTSTAYIDTEISGENGMLLDCVVAPIITNNRFEDFTIGSISPYDGSYSSIARNTLTFNYYDGRNSVNLQKNENFPYYYIPTSRAYHVLADTRDTAQILIVNELNYMNTATPTVAAKTGNIYIGYSSFRGTPRKGIYYRVKITKDILVRDYIPCISPDNVVGMYDLVEGKFYSSPNGVAFVAGPVIS